MSYLLGVDVGSTNLKAVLYDLSGNEVASASEPTQKVSPDADHPDWWVWQPEQIWGGIASSINQVVSKIKDPKEIKGVSVTGMGTDGLPIDGSGDWLYPFISWHCNRSLSQSERLSKTVGAEKLFSISGSQIWPFNTLYRLMWMNENEPEILEKTHKWLMVEDYINFMLCGEFATDYSMASSTSMLDEQKQQWSDELLNTAGIKKEQLCEPIPAGTVIGNVHSKASEKTGLAKGTPIVLGGHDYSCGCLPTGAFAPGVILDVIGTWEMLVTTIDKPLLVNSLCNAGAVIDSHVVNGKWAILAASVAGDMTEWFKSQFTYEEVKQANDEQKNEWHYIVKNASASPAGANGVLFLPHMSGSSGPVVDPLSTGAFVGLTNSHTKADMFRALIEGINLQFKDILDNLEGNMDKAPDKIIAIGGPTRNDLWMQTKADISGKTVEIPDVAEPVTLGAAMLAGIGSGVYDDLPQAYEAVRKKTRTVEPNEKEHSKYIELYQKYKKLYPALKGIR
jgi:xylulokinase